MKDSSATLGDEIKKAESLVETARRLLADGRSLDLQALGGRIGGICRELTALPEDSEARPDLRASAERLIRALDVLEQDLEARRRDAASVLAGERSKQANDAYKVIPSLGEGTAPAAIETAARHAVPSTAVEAVGKGTEHPPGEGNTKDTK